MGTAGSDNCSPPTAEPTTQPTPQPTADPTPAPTPTPTDQMMAPSPVGGVAGAAPISGVPAIGTDGCAPPMGQCAGNGMTGRLCCSAGYVCTDVTNFFSQCQPGQGAAANLSGDSGMGMQTMLMIIAVVFLLALICGSVLVHFLCIKKSGDADAYQKHNSL